jgi:hypothetical protein
MTDLVIRPLESGEEDLFLSLSDPALVGVASVGRDYRSYVESGEYRPEWTWVALRDGRTVARAAWWGGPQDTEPRTLDWFDFDDSAAGEALLRTSPLRAEFCLILPPRWRADPEVRAAAERRIETATRAGMTPLVERLRYLWTPADGLPERTDRLEYRPEPDDDVVLDVLRQMVRGSLDAHSRRTVAAKGLEAAAKDELDFLNWMPSPREWWRLVGRHHRARPQLRQPGDRRGRRGAGPARPGIWLRPARRGHPSAGGAGS